MTMLEYNSLYCVYSSDTKFKGENSSDNKKLILSKKKKKRRRFLHSLGNAIVNRKIRFMKGEDTEQ